MGENISNGIHHLSTASMGVSRNKNRGLQEPWLLYAYTLLYGCERLSLWFQYVNTYIYILHIKYVYLYLYIYLLYYIYTPIYVYVFPIENMFDPYGPMDFPILKNLEPRRTTPPGMTNRNTTIFPLILSCAVYSIRFCASYCMYYIYTHLCWLRFASCAGSKSPRGPLCFCLN